jgi:hypothetical protein
LWAHPVDDAIVAAHAARDADASAAFEAAVLDLRERERAQWPARVGRAPRSEREAQAAEAAACVDNPFPSGLSPSLAHTTGTGRLAWEVAADGEVTLTVSRPAVAVAIQVSVDGRGRVLIHRAHAGVYAWRHVDALAHALRALGAEELPLVVALNADDDWAAIAAACTARAAEAEALAAEAPDARDAYLVDAAWLRARAEAWRAWARHRRPVIRGGTAADYAAEQERMWSAQRSLLNTLLGSAT